MKSIYFTLVTWTWLHCALLSTSVLFAPNFSCTRLMLGGITGGSVSRTLGRNVINAAGWARLGIKTSKHFYMTICLERYISGHDKWREEGATGKDNEMNSLSRVISIISVFRVRKIEKAWSLASKERRREKVAVTRRINVPKYEISNKAINGRGVKPEAIPVWPRMAILHCSDIRRTTSIGAEGWMTPQ